MITPEQLVIIVWVIFILYWLVSSFSVKRDATKRPWWRSWWLRGAVIAIALAVLAHTSFSQNLTEHMNLWQQTQATVWLAYIGAALTVLGIALAIWARVHLGRNWSPAPAIKEEHELVTSGPYGVVRHPIYTGVIAAMLGSALISPTWLIILIVFGAIFVRRVGIEEGFMVQQFPNQYPEYKKHTWALVPFIY